MVNYWLILTRNFTGTQVITNVVFFRTSSVDYLTIWKKQILVRIGQKKLTYSTGSLKRTLNLRYQRLEEQIKIELWRTWLALVCKYPWVNETLFCTPFYLYHKKQNTYYIHHVHCRICILMLLHLCSKWDIQLKKSYI